MDCHVGYGKNVEVDFVEVWSAYPEEVKASKILYIPKRETFDAYFPDGWDVELYCESNILREYQKKDPNIMIFITGIKEVE